MSNLNTQATVNLTVNGQQPAQVLQQLKQRAMELENAIAKAAVAGNKVELRKLRRELGDTRTWPSGSCRRAVRNFPRS